MNGVSKPALTQACSRAEELIDSLGISDHEV